MDIDIDIAAAESELLNALRRYNEAMLKKMWAEFQNSAVQKGNRLTDHV